jgi:hypothetical protein
MNSIVYLFINKLYIYFQRNSVIHEAYYERSNANTEIQYNLGKSRPLKIYRPLLYPIAKLNDNINQLVIQQSSLPPQVPVTDSVPEVIFMCF